MTSTARRLDDVVVDKALVLPGCRYRRRDGLGTWRPQVVLIRALQEGQVGATGFAQMRMGHRLIQDPELFLLLIEAVGRILAHPGIAVGMGVEHYKLVTTMAVHADPRDELGAAGVEGSAEAELAI